MLDVLRSIWIWCATATLILLWVPLVALVGALDRDPLRRRTARVFRFLGPMVGKANPAWRIRMKGKENVQPGQVYVVVVNHQSLADIPLVAHLGIEAKWLGKSELFDVPVFGWFMRTSGDIGVDRTDRRKAALALLQCTRLLRKGVSIVFFPEGTRSPDGSILPFNDGPFQLAIREGVPVLPVVLDGTGSALPRSTWKFGGTQDLHLRALPAIPSSGWTSERTGEFREHVRAVMIEELHRIRRV